MNLKQRRVAYESKIFSVEERQYEQEGGKLSRSVVTHPGAVVIIPLDDDGSVIFVRQYRHAVKMQLLELPAGTLESGEDPLVCAQRELQEECGVRARELIQLARLLPAPGFCNEVQYLFLARGLERSELPRDEDEIIEVTRIPRAEVKEALFAEELLDSKSLAAFFILEQYEGRPASEEEGES